MCNVLAIYSKCNLKWSTLDDVLKVNSMLVAYIPLKKPCIEFPSIYWIDVPNYSNLHYKIEKIFSPEWVKDVWTVHLSKKNKPLCYVFHSAIKYLPHEYLHPCISYEERRTEAENAGRKTQNVSLFVESQKGRCSREGFIFFSKTQCSCHCSFTTSCSWTSLFAEPRWLHAGGPAPRTGWSVLTRQFRCDPRTWLSSHRSCGWRWSSGRARRRIWIYVSCSWHPYLRPGPTDASTTTLFPILISHAVQFPTLRQDLGCLVIFSVHHRHLLPGHVGSLHRTCLVESCRPVYNYLPEYLLYLTSKWNQLLYSKYFYRQQFVGSTWQVVKDQKNFHLFCKAFG